MTLQTLMEHALRFPCACAENPFGPDSVCIRIGAHGPIFLNLMPVNNWASFRCEAEMGLIWRNQFPGTVRRGWHCPPVQQPYNNTVTLDGTVPDDILLEMLSHSYARASKGLKRKSSPKQNPQEEVCESKRCMPETPNSSVLKP